MENIPEEIPLCSEAGNGESIAVKSDETGFVTVSEVQDEIDAKRKIGQKVNEHEKVIIPNQLVLL